MTTDQQLATLRQIKALRGTLQVQRYTLIAVMTLQVLCLTTALFILTH
jgi:hypothetical protein